MVVSSSLDAQAQSTDEGVALRERLRALARPQRQHLWSAQCLSTYGCHAGTHRELFEIEEVQLKQFIDEGLHSHAYVAQPRRKPKLRDILKNPALLILPKVLEAYLENFFPYMGIMHGESPLFSLRECHFYLPESETHSRVYVLLFMKA